ncbi:MAG TPA: cytochrome ubiquinol oxidase subunit I [Dissulfurispiraceae bacterium]|nr:cytochrome ubiquinol oxidase subunit I [Dissulfurispiraceae bacterium]
MLSRIQFAVTAAFHFIFVPLTLGLSWLVAYMEWRYVRTGDAMYLKMTKFWGKLFLINFALGVVTGLTMEFQFGMNWAEYSKYVGDIFGAPLAIEATLAFFLESTFMGVWIFGWNRITKRLHAWSITIVAFATNLSALWILLANGWMQNPVGYVLRNGRAEMVDFGALLANPYGWTKFFHTLTASYVLAAFFVMAIAAYHLVRKNNVRLFKTSFRYASYFSLVSALLVLGSGDFHGVEVAKVQPTKFAAMESHWETQQAAGYPLLIVPDPANERNAVEAVTIPRMLSMLAFHDPNATVKGLKDYRNEDRPPVTATFLSFRLMVAMGMLLILVSLVAVILSVKDRLESSAWFLKLMLYVLPIPYLGVQLGWIVAEVGRQPWAVYGVLRTSDGVSQAIEPMQVVVSLIGFTLLYGTLAAVDLYLLKKYAQNGPDENLDEIVKMTRV